MNKKLVTNELVKIAKELIAMISFDDAVCKIQNLIFSIIDKIEEIGKNSSLDVKSILRDMDEDWKALEKWARNYGISSTIAHLDLYDSLENAYKKSVKDLKALANGKEILSSQIMKDSKELEKIAVDLLDELFEPYNEMKEQLKVEKSHIRTWYCRSFPTDSLGKKINPKATFNDLYVALEDHRDIYKVIGVKDSTVRERIFKVLAEIMSMSYDEIYQMWEEN